MSFGWSELRIVVTPGRRIGRSRSGPPAADAKNLLSLADGKELRSAGWPGRSTDAKRTKRAFRPRVLLDHSVDVSHVPAIDLLTQ